VADDDDPVTKSGTLGVLLPWLTPALPAREAWFNGELMAEPIPSCKRWLLPELHQND
jgi:hypothetical protein